MPATATVRQGANSDYRGLNILNLGTGANAVPDLAAELIGLRGSKVYGFVLGSALSGNIAVLPFSASNTFPEGASNSTFGSGFNANTALGSFNRNKLGNDVGANRFGTAFNDNEIGDLLKTSTFGSSNFSNEIGNVCSDLVFGNGCKFNVLFDNNNRITLGDAVTYCEVQAGCNNVSIGANSTNVRVINCRGTFNPGTGTTTPFAIPANSSNVTYRDNALVPDPYGVAGKLDKAANLSDVQDKKTSRKNLGLTDDTDKILATYLPGFVDEVNDDYPTLAALQAAIPAGSKGVIYITTDNDKQYRWSGTAYHEMVQTPGTTDAVAEGQNNLYFTQARAIGSLLVGYAKAATGRALAATDSVLIAFGILEKKADDNANVIAGIGTLIPANASPTNQLLTAASLQGIAPGVLEIPIESDVVTINHNRNRWVLVQAFEKDGTAVIAQIKQLSKNTVEVSLNAISEGTILVY
jgi:hypothetical protein